MLYVVRCMFFNKQNKPLGGYINNGITNYTYVYNEEWYRLSQLYCSIGKRITKKECKCLWKRHATKMKKNPITRQYIEKQINSDIM